MLPITLPLQFGNACVLFRDVFACGQQGEHHDLRTLLGQLPSLCFGECASHRGLDQTVCRLRMDLRRLHVRRNKRPKGSAQVAYFNILRPGLALQTAGVLPGFKGENARGNS